jgi:hypothetical protein
MAYRIAVTVALFAFSCAPAVAPDLTDPMTVPDGGTVAAEPDSGPVDSGPVALPDGGIDGGATDAGPVEDAGAPDAGTTEVDAGEPVDAGQVPVFDAGVCTNGGFGSGGCCVSGCNAGEACYVPGDRPDNVCICDPYTCTGSLWCDSANRCVPIPDGGGTPGTPCQTVADCDPNTRCWGAALYQCLGPDGGPPDYNGCGPGLSCPPDQFCMYVPHTAPMVCVPCDRSGHPPDSGSCCSGVILTTGNCE